MKIRRCLISYSGAQAPLSRDFADGFNRMDPDAAEEVLMYAFVKCMLSGIGDYVQEDAGDLAQLEAAGVIEGSLWFEQEDKLYRLTRRFDGTQGQRLFLIGEGGIERKQTKLPELLSAGVCGNMITKKQLEAVKKGSLAERLTGRRQAGSAQRDARGAVQILKMTRKGFQDQISRRRRAEEKDTSVMENRESILQKEIRDLEEKRMRAAEEEIQEKYSRDASELAQRMDEVWERRSRLKKGKTLAAVITLILASAALFFSWIPALLILAGGGILYLLLHSNEQKAQEELRRIRGQRKKRKEKLRRMTRRREELEESILDRKREIRNVSRSGEAYAAEKKTYPEEAEIEALNMAIERIESLSGKGFLPFGGQLRQHASLYLKELTGGTCSEVLLDEDMHICVRQKETLIPEQDVSLQLMKVIYLALRLAESELLQVSSDSPFVVDDLSAHADETCRQSLEKLLKGSGKQVLAGC